MDNIVKGGMELVRAHLKHLKEHGQEEDLQKAMDFLREKKIEVPMEKSEESGHRHGRGCPGMRVMDFRDRKGNPDPSASEGPMQTELRQWPIQLALLNPTAPYFKEADLLIAADCAPFAHPEFHRRFLKGKTLVMFCPKLDPSMDLYLEKLTAILRENMIKSISVIHMEVPCCSGIVRLLEEALRRSGKNIMVKQYTLSLRGEII